MRQQGGTTGSFVTLLNGDTDYEPEFAYSYAPSAVPNLTPLPK